MKVTAFVVAALAFGVSGAFAQNSVGINPNAADRPTLQMNGPTVGIDFRRTASIYRTAPAVNVQRNVSVSRYGDPSLYRGED